MFSDNSLTPREAIRLCALGTLARSASAEGKTYNSLANEIRQFVSRITGPSLDLMGESLELLKYEGLIQTIESSKENHDPALKITKEGVKVLNILLSSNIRAGNSELDKLIVALKLRFLYFLPEKDQLEQLEIIIDISSNEITRLESLIEKKDNNLNLWLKNDITWLESRLEILTTLQQSIKNI
ncbi:MAG: hypothetical protein VX617_03220 [Pseudomonadota bacterium]|nr:hypothetical protein [Pseudomonadota bacterium]